MSAIQLQQQNILLLEGVDGRTNRSRISRYAAWVDHPLVPDLSRYRDHLISLGHRPESVKSVLSTIRSRYRQILVSEAFRTEAYRMAREALGEHAPLADLSAFVSEMEIRIRNAIDPSRSAVKVVQHQDATDDSGLRLSTDEAESMLNAPHFDRRPGMTPLRDTAIIALMLCTGVREAELCSLEVRDLRQQFGGELALHIREGKGAKSRLVPYGSLSWCLLAVDAWLSAAGITAGPVFRGFYKGAKRVRPGALTERAVLDVVTSYPIIRGGRTVTVRPHDLRRTYARQLYESGMELVEISQNLGHASTATTLLYIGTLDAARRAPKSLYRKPSFLK